ncbi:RNA recognition motif [Gracilaria domingensis]|nr:RNA recognition motif [Gracilaria domingensis]
MKESQDRKTLFVGNLHESVTKEDVESHFGGIGPLRHAFLVTTPGSTLCKGYGFVTFAFSEDADRARTVLNQSILKGRKISLDIARKRLRGSNDRLDGRAHQDREPKESSARSRKEKKNSAVGSVPMRTVLLRKESSKGVFTEEEAKEAVGAHLEASGFQTCVLTSDGRQARCLYDSWSNAGKAAGRAHGGSIDAVIEALKAGQRTKLIVRNLPFKVNEQQLRAAFESIAPIRTLRLAPSSELRRHDTSRAKKHTLDSPPEKDVEDVKSQSQLVSCAGYGFIEFFLVAHAQTAVKKLNGTKIGGRVIAVDMAVSKSQYVAQNLDQEPEIEADEAHEPAEEEDQENSAAETGSSKLGLENERAQQLGVKETKEGDCHDEQSSEYKKSQRRVAKDAERELPRTIFVRNVLFETSVPELREAFENRFGRVQKVLLVKHPATGRPRGTAFVIFKDEKTAREAAGQSSRSELEGSEDSSAPNPTDFVLHGRKLLLSMAVDRTTAKDLKSTAPLHTRKNKDSDPRNLRLAWVGHIASDSKEAQRLSPNDLSRRSKAEKEKQMKLERNPNAFISEVRLSVRNLPRECDEKALKQIFILSAQEKGGQDEEGFSAGFPKVTHVAVVRDSDRNDRSKGYGFVQFSEHEHAMRALLHLNNNPHMIEWLIQKKPKPLHIDETRAELLRKQWKNRRLIVEFAVEDKRIVQVLDRVRGKGKEHGEKKRKKTEDDGEEQPKRKKLKQAAMNQPLVSTNEPFPQVSGEIKGSLQSRSQRRFHHKRKHQSSKESVNTIQANGVKRGLSDVKVQHVESIEQKFSQKTHFSNELKRRNEAKNKGSKNKSKKTTQDVKFDRLVDEYKRKLTNATENQKNGLKARKSLQIAAPILYLSKYSGLAYMGVYNQAE